MENGKPRYKGQNPTEELRQEPIPPPVPVGLTTTAEAVGVTPPITPARVGRLALAQTLHTFDLRIFTSSQTADGFVLRTRSLSLSTRRAMATDAP